MSVWQNDTVLARPPTCPARTPIDHHRVHAPGNRTGRPSGRRAASGAAVGRHNSRRRAGLAVSPRGRSWEPRGAFARSRSVAPDGTAAARERLAPLAGNLGPVRAATARLLRLLGAVAAAVDQRLERVNSACMPRHRGGRAAWADGFAVPDRDGGRHHQRGGEEAGRLGGGRLDLRLIGSLFARMRRAALSELAVKEVRSEGGIARTVQRVR